MVRVCDGKSLPKGDPNAVYMLRTFGGEAHEIWNVADPVNPTLITRIGGLKDTHKNWWECQTGIAFLVSGLPDWRTRRMTQIYDLQRSRTSVKIRDFGLPGQEPGATGAGADRGARADLGRPEGNRRLFRIWHRQGRLPADRRSRRNFSMGRRSRRRIIFVIRKSRGLRCRRSTAPHHISDAEDADRRICQGQGKQSRHRHDRG